MLDRDPGERARGARRTASNATRTTLAAFAISGFMAAFAGVLYVHQQSGLGVAAFLPYESLTAFSMVVIGGLGSLSGALIGAFYVRGRAVLPARQLGSARERRRAAARADDPAGRHRRGDGGRARRATSAGSRTAAGMLVPSLRRRPPARSRSRSRPRRSTAAVEAAESEPIPEQML